VNEQLVTVHLLGLPLALHRKTSDHLDTLRRELALIEVGREADASARLNALSEEVGSRFRGFTAAQEAALADAPAEGTIDLSYELPADAADASERLALLLDEVDDLCRAGELVTLCSPADVLAYRRWFLGEFIGQIREGRAPVPWEAPAPASDHVDVAATTGDLVEGEPIVVSGDLDLFGAPALRAAISERLEAGERAIKVDLSQCRFIDSVGLSLLLTTRERCRAVGGALKVIGADESALRLFETVGVRQLLT
jgi:anti-sigma B factor antagonist